MKFFIATTITAILIAGCSGTTNDATPTATPTETVTPIEPTPTPTVVVLTREQAADLYMEIATPANDAIKNLDAVLLRFEEGDYTTESAILEQIREAALTIETINTEDNARWIELQSTAIEGIDPTIWHNAMADLLRQEAGYTPWIHALTEVQVYQDVWDAAEDFAIEDTGAADVVRAYLGLPGRT